MSERHFTPSQGNYPRGEEWGKERPHFTPSGYFARLYQFLVREPPSLPVFDTKLVGSFFTPSGQKAPVTRGFPGDFAELYGSDNASLYRRSGADCKSDCLRRFILPHLSISPNCIERFGVIRSFAKLFGLRLLLDLNAVPKGKYHAAIDVYDGLFYQRIERRMEFPLDAPPASVSLL